MAFRPFLLTILAALSMVFLSSAFADSFPPIVVPWFQERGSIEHTSQRAIRDPLPAQNGGTQQAPAPRPIDHGRPFDPVRQTAMALSSHYNLERPDEPSALENMYSDRVVDEVKQFGYDLFGVPSSDTIEALQALSSAQTKNETKKETRPLGAVQDDFILNSGDRIEIVFTGGRTDRGVHEVTSQGLLLIKDLPPIPAAGRSIAQVRLSIDTAARNLHNTEAYVALAEVRQIDVLIVGHARRPGRKSLTVFHTVLDALMEAGGVEKTGSLRQIKLVRGGRSQIIDLYGLLMHGATNMDFRLRDGDRIIVPPIGPTVAVAGEVKRPGIYEILPTLSGMRHKPGKSAQKVSLNDMLDFAGGVLAPGKNRFLKLSITGNGQEHVNETSSAFAPEFGDGAILVVSKGREKRKGMIELAGHTLRPGLYARSEVPTLKKLISTDDVLGADIYPLIAIIERNNKDTLAKTLEGFPLQLVIAGQYDRKLKDGDTIRLFSNEQIDNLDDALEALQDEEENKPQIIAMGSQPDYTRYDAEEEDHMIDDPVILSFLRERYAFVRGAVRSPGPYPVAEGTTLKSILAVAGGLALEANTGNIEVTSHHDGGTQRTKIDFRDTSPENIEISAGDAVRINQKFKKITDKSVQIIGEVLHPGRYDLLPGDKISDLLNRAGGLTEQAYAEGAIFSRQSERRAEEARFRAAARDLERAVAMAIEKQDDGPDVEQIAMTQELAAELREVEAVGRITVEADPSVLVAEPELDMLLESGDRIYIPKRPLTVRVRGEVLSPASLQFRTSKKPRDYINEAGGFTFEADKDRAFVIYPDGSGQPLEVSSWNYNPVLIPPGSTIVVPRDPEPFDFVQSAKDISQILSNLAITGVFINDIRDDD